MIDELNRKHAIEDHVYFIEGSGGLPKAVVSSRFALAEVYLHGAHVRSFQPHGCEPVLWMSRLAQFEADKAIRGGIPVVWPWFGPHPSDSAKPQHGFARTMGWTPVSAAVLPDGRTQLILRLRDSTTTRALWPHSFALDLVVTVGCELCLQLVSRNTGTEPLDVGGALHSYFNIGDIRQVRVEGLDGREYIDQLDAHRVKLQNGPINFFGEVDRIYVDTADDCVIDDPSLKRKIRILKKGSLTTVIWNPWMAKAARMIDFPDDGYLKMLCVETANAAVDVRRVPSGQEHMLTQIISVE